MPFSPQSIEHTESRINTMRLQAAAPDLLKALRNVCNGLYALRDHAQQEYGVAASIEQRLINECITAIAKATGE